MKIVIAMVVVLAILGGAGFGLYKAGKLPFLHPKKTTKKAKPGAAHPAVAAAAASTPPPSSAPAPKPAAPRPKLSRPDPEAAAKAEQRMARLVALYEGMSADDAKPIVEKLPDTLVADLLRRMDERQAGKLLAGMKADRAAKLTGILAKAPAAGVVASQ